MGTGHVFVETNFLFSAFRLPSQRRRDAVALRNRFEAEELRLYVPYLCFQEAKHLISKSLPSHRWDDIQQFHRFCVEQGSASWDFSDVRKLLDAAAREVNRTRAVFQKELAEFCTDLGDGLLHGIDAVFDFMEGLQLDHELEFNDRMVLCSVLVKANQLQKRRKKPLFFACTDKDLRPTEQTPKSRQYYAQAGLTFVWGFDLPESAENAGIES